MHPIFPVLLNYSVCMQARTSSPPPNNTPRSPSLGSHNPQLPMQAVTSPGINNLLRYYRLA